MSSTLVERFELLGELGRGGMGVVYRARERATGREVALKVLAPGAHDPELVLRARREAEALAAVRHPGIVAVHAAGESDGRPWIACELVEGARPLDRAWADLDRAARVGLVRDVARALGHAHGRGIVHRDVKAQNVLVGDDGRARLADFGLALLRGAERLTATGTLLGTPTAMAPEQVQGERGAIGPWTDTWALGVLLYEALTGQRPFGGRTLYEVAMRVLQAAPAAPRTLDPAVPPALEAVALRALSRAPGDRYADGASFAAALDLALAPVADRRRLRAVWTAAGGLTLAALAAALLVAPRRPSPTPPLPPRPPALSRPSPAPAEAPATPAPSPTAALAALRPDAAEAELLGFIPREWHWRRALGLARLNGSRNLTPDPVRAEAWLRAAAELDRDPTAMVALGVDLVDQGRVDLAEGEGWLARAAELGDPDAMFWLASRLEHREPRRALALVERAVEAGRGGNAWRLLARLRRSQGDLAGAARALAATWQEQRPLENHADALIELADLHLQGVAVIDTSELRSRLATLGDAHRGPLGRAARERLAALERAGAR